eukprot:gb/GEZN01003234.1/.p1 GENE.gb/GEZN01003234.1/~~gb/GEZN01003234.1/.p1  ORF type:complete len:555 (-),score=31.89 gb/GEZN01003234.1/:274-1938(-)
MGPCVLLLLPLLLRMAVAFDFLPLLAVTPASMDATRRFLGMQSGHSESAVGLFPINLGFPHVHELTNVHNVIVLTREQLTSENYSTVVAGLQALSQGGDMLPMQDLLLIDQSADWPKMDKILDVQKAKKVFEEQQPPVKALQFSLIHSGDPSIVPGIALRSKLIAPDHHARLAAWLATVLPFCLNFPEALVPTWPAEECNKKGIDFLKTWVDGDSSIVKILGPWTAGIYVNAKTKYVPNCATRHVIRNSEVNALPGQTDNESYRPNSICLCTPTRLKVTTKDGCKTEEIFRDLLTSIQKTWRDALRQAPTGKLKDYHVRVYVGYEDGDPVLGSDFHAGPHCVVTEFKKLFENLPADIRLIGMPFTDHDPVYMWNMLFQAAYGDGCEFLWHSVDDMQLRNHVWLTDWPNAFHNASLFPNFGLGGINAATGKLRYTQPYVHRTHMEIFGQFYPHQLHNWWSDNVLYYIYRLDWMRGTHNLDFSNKNRKGSRYDICWTNWEVYANAWKEKLDNYVKKRMQAENIDTAVVLPKLHLGPPVYEDHSIVDAAKPWPGTQK